MPNQYIGLSGIDKRQFLLLDDFITLTNATGVITKWISGLDYFTDGVVYANFWAFGGADTVIDIRVYTMGSNPNEVTWIQIAYAPNVGNGTAIRINNFFLKLAVYISITGTSPSVSGKVGLKLWG